MQLERKCMLHMSLGSDLPPIYGPGAMLVNSEF